MRGGRQDVLGHARLQASHGGRVAHLWGLHGGRQQAAVTQGHGLMRACVCVCMGVRAWVFVGRGVGG